VKKYIEKMSREVEQDKEMELVNDELELANRSRSHTRSRSPHSPESSSQNRSRSHSRLRQSTSGLKKRVNWKKHCFFKFSCLYCCE
jgi:hypothetical protein